MGTNYYTLDEITVALGLDSPHSARNHIKAIRDLLEDRGWLVHLPKANALGVSPEGLELLRRFNDAFRSGQTREAARARLYQDLEFSPLPEDASGPTVNPLDHRMRELEVQLAQALKDIYALRDETNARLIALEVRLPFWRRVSRLLPRPTPTSSDKP